MNIEIVVCTNDEGHKRAVYDKNTGTFLFSFEDSPEMRLLLTQVLDYSNMLESLQVLRSEADFLKDEATRLEAIATKLEKGVEDRDELFREIDRLRTENRELKQLLATLARETFNDR